MRRLLILDILAEDNGHLIEDDFFLAMSLHRHFVGTRLLSSPASIVNLKARLPQLTANALPCHTGKSKKLPHRIKTLCRVLSVKVRDRDELILLQGFEEIAAFIFMLRHKHNHIFLKVTNNLGNLKNNWKRRLALKFVLPLATGILVHCEYEKEIILDLYDINPNKIHLVKFHQFGRNDFPYFEIKRQHKISYIGGGRPGMGLNNFLKLSEESPFPGYSYSLNSRVSEEIAKLNYPDLEINNRFLNEPEYFKKFYESQYVIMPYSGEYEGKTSGIFCDAVLTETPVIAPKIEPFTSFFSRYGLLGHLIDFDDINWLEHVKKIDLNENYAVFQQNLKRVNKDHNWDAIGPQLAEIINKVNMVNK